MNWLKSIFILAIFSSLPTWAEAKFRLEVDQVRLSQVWQLVSEACPTESRSYRLQNPDKLVSVSTDEIDCQSIFDKLTLLDAKK